MRDTNKEPRARWIVGGAPALGLALLAAGSALAEPAASGSTVIINVGKLRSLKGNIACRLHSTEKSFPRGTEGTVRQGARVSGEFTRCSFKNVAPGTYALTAIHDENDNGKLDRNFLGMPTEGYGVSNNQTYATRAPVWSECKFVVEPGKNRELNVSIRY